MSESKTLLRGGQRAQEEAAKAKTNRTSTYGLWEYFSLDAPAEGEVNGGSEVIRLILDEPDFIEAKQHSYTSTKSAPADLPEGKKWRPKVDATCRYTRVQEGTLYDDCYVCDNVTVMRNGKESKAFPSTKLWVPAVIRIPVKVTQEHVDKGLAESFEIGSYSLYEDDTVEKEIDGKKVMLPRFVVLNFGFKNFFDKLLGFHNVYGTLLDRDYKITRKGSGTDTDYIIVPLDPQKDLETGGKFDLRNPDIASRYQLPTGEDWVTVLTKVVMDKASDDYYGFFFDPSKNISWESRFGKSTKDEVATVDAEATEQFVPHRPDPEQESQNTATIEAMRDRMRRKRS
jgi:hypothetical protein